MDYINTACKLSIVSGIFIILCVLVLFGADHAVGVTGGLAFSLVNLYVLANLIKNTLGYSRKARVRNAILWILKIPVLYGACIALILSPLSSPVGFIVGFSIWFVMIFAVALKRALA